MKCLLLTLALVVCVSAKDHECGPLERLKVKTQWVQAYSLHSEQREGFGREVWLDLLKFEPKIASLLERVRGDNVYSPEFESHMVRVFGGLDICISLLSDEETLTAQLTHLRDQHDERGIPHEYFTYMAKTLTRTLPKHVPFFDQDAWTACLKVITTGITKDLTEDD